MSRPSNPDASVPPSEPRIGTHTASGFEVAPVYGPPDQRPGVAPFTRGPSVEMYRDGPWVMGMYSGRASPKETNTRIRNLLAAGQRGFSIALDLPTQVGLDSDHPLAAGEVGKVGVPIDTVDDMAALLDGIDLAHVSQIRTTANAIGPIALALFVGAAEAHGVSPHDFKVLLQNDSLKEYVARGTYIFPPASAREFSVDVIEYCAQHLPHWEPIEFCGYHVRDSGSTAVQEVAVALANGTAYIDAALARGLHVDQFAHGIYLFLSAGLDLFEEVAKFRAARRLWYELLHDRYGARDHESLAAKLFVYTLGSASTAQEPINNVVRIAYEALAAVLGGVQTLATTSYDEAIGLPSAEAAHIALRTQQVLAFETGAARTADPLGGSWFVEDLTDRLVVEVRETMAEFDRQGGPIAIIESGWLRNLLDQEAYHQQLAVERGERTVVGVNAFTGGPTSAVAPIPGPSAQVESEQIARLAQARAKRNQVAVDSRLHDLERTARARANTVPAIIEAMRANATIGEVCTALGNVWGRHREEGFR